MGPEKANKTPDAKTVPDVFDEALEAINAKNVASKKADEIIEKARVKWLEINASSRNRPFEGDIKARIARIIGFVRRRGLAVAKWMSIGGGGAAGIGWLADDGAFTGLFENFSLIGQIFGW